MGNVVDKGISKVGSKAGSLAKKGAKKAGSMAKRGAKKSGAKAKQATSDTTKTMAAKAGKAASKLANKGIDTAKAAKQKGAQAMADRKTKVAPQKIKKAFDNYYTSVGKEMQDLSDFMGKSMGIKGGNVIEVSAALMQDEDKNKKELGKSLRMIHRVLTSLREKLKILSNMKFKDLLYEQEILSESKAKIFLGESWNKFDRDTKTAISMYEVHFRNAFEAINEELTNGECSVILENYVRDYQLLTEGPIDNLRAKAAGKLAGNDTAGLETRLNLFKKNVGTQTAKLMVGLDKVGSNSPTAKKAFDIIKTELDKIGNIEIKDNSLGTKAKELTAQAAKAMMTKLTFDSKGNGSYQFSKFLQDKTYTTLKLDKFDAYSNKS